MLNSILFGSIAALAVAAVGCGGGGGGGGGTDAPVTAAFASVTCPATPDATITTSGLAYSPAATSITVGQTVQFVMPASHNVSGTGANATSLMVDFGATGCFKFTAAGTFNFKCTMHGFTGSITAQ
jgi:plastocyanin